MRRSLLGALLLFSLSAFGKANLSILSFTADKNTVQAGEPLALTIGVTNIGPDAAINPNLNLGNDAGRPMFILSSSANAGWVCSSAYTNCFASTFPAGGNATLSLTVVVPATDHKSPLTISLFGGPDNESDSSDNRAELSVEVTRPPTTADLSISVAAPPNPFSENTAVTLTYDVRNNGTDDLTDVRVPVYVGSAQNPTVGGIGWTCTPDGISLTTCQRDSLAAGVSTPIAVHLITPSLPQEFSTRADVFSGQAHLDPNPSNELAEFTIFVGSAATWSRVLLPITMDDIPGTHGSLWKTEISALIESNTHITIEPNGCGPIEDPCQPPPLNTLLDVRNESLIIDNAGTQFLYVATEDASKLKISTRVYDASKSTETAGAFLPIARDDDFSAQGFSLIAIPLAPELRSTLRIYDYDGAEGVIAGIALFGDAETQPFYQGSVSLHVPSGALETLTTALLPAHPAYAQLDLGPLIPAGAYSRVRARIQPLSAGSKLWGFGSITNNETSHVSIVSP